MLEKAYKEGDREGLLPSQIAESLDLMTDVRDRAGKRSAGSKCVWGILVTLDQKGLVDHLKESENSWARWRWHSAI